MLIKYLLVPKDAVFVALQKLKPLDGTVGLKELLNNVVLEFGVDPKPALLDWNVFDGFPLNVEPNPAVAGFDTNKLLLLELVDCPNPKLLVDVDGKLKLVLFWGKRPIF